MLCDIKLKTTDTLLLQSITIIDAYALERYPQSDSSNYRLKISNNILKSKKQYIPYFEINIENKVITKFELALNIPKLVYDTNYFMVKETDLDQCINTLVDLLNSFGISVNRDFITRLEIYKATFSFNILLPENFDKVKNILTILSNKSFSNYLVQKSSTHYLEDNFGIVVSEKSKNRKLKIYDKSSELINCAKLERELEIKHTLQNNILPNRMLRFEYEIDSVAFLKEKVNKFYNRDENSKISIIDIFNSQLSKNLLLSVFSIGKQSESSLLAFSLVKENQIFPSFSSITDVITQSGLGYQDGLILANILAFTQVYGEKEIRSFIYENAGSNSKGYELFRSIDSKLNRRNLSGFSIKDLFDEITIQFNEFRLFSSENELLETFRLVNNRQKK